METISINYLLTAKQEYEKKLISILQDYIYAFYNNLYQESVSLCHEENNPANILMVYQNKIERVSRWTVKTKNNFYVNFVKKTGCDYFSDLVKIIFITQIKILTLLGHDKEKIRIKLPIVGDFIYNILLDCGRNIWQLPYLFNSINYKSDILNIIEKSIINVIQDSIPMEKLINSCNIDEYDNVQENKKIKTDLKNITLSNNNTESSPQDNENDKSVENESKKVSFSNDLTETIPENIKPVNIDTLELNNDYKRELEEFFINNKHMNPTNLNEIDISSLNKNIKIDDNLTEKNQDPIIPNIIPEKVKNIVIEESIPEKTDEELKVTKVDEEETVVEDSKTEEKVDVDKETEKKVDEETVVEDSKTEEKEESKETEKEDGIEVENKTEENLAEESKTEEKEDENLAEESKKVEETQQESFADLLTDIDEINLDSILQENKKSKKPTLNLKSKFSFF